MDLFWLKLILSFIVGGAFIAFTIWVSEKYGSKLGGVIIGLPSTSLVGLLFIAWSQNNMAAVSAVPIMPAVAGINSIFVALFVLLSSRGLKQALIIAFVFWFLSSLAVVLLPLDSLAISLGIAACLYAISATFLSKFPHRKIAANKSTWKEFIFRSILAGTVVATAVLLAKNLGPLWGGVFSNFPAAFTSTLILVTKKHGVEFTKSVARTMAFASIAAVSFSVAFYFLVPQAGLGLGALLSVSISVAIGYFIYRFAL